MYASVHHQVIQDQFIVDSFSIGFLYIQRSVYIGLWLLVQPCVRVSTMDGDEDLSSHIWANDATLAMRVLLQNVSIHKIDALC